MDDRVTNAVQIAARQQWQRSLLPFMIAILVFSALFFAWQSVAQYNDLRDRIAPPRTDLSSVFEKFEAAAANEASRLEYMKWKTAVLLEQEALKHRYAQISSTILTRAWTRALGFTVGMVLAIVGAAFILGRLEESQTELKNESELLKISLATSSPGIVLAVLGCFLMSVTLLVRFDIEIRDGGNPSITTSALPSPGTTNQLVPQTSASPSAGGSP